MPLSHWACANCGFWQLHFAPPDCPCCTDVRNDLPEDGWRFLPEVDVVVLLQRVAVGGCAFQKPEQCVCG